MNEKGIKNFLNKLKEGQEIMVSTRGGSYEGMVENVNETWFTIDGSPVDYSSIWWHSLEG